MNRQFCGMARRSGGRWALFGAIVGLALTPMAQAGLIGQWTFNEGSGSIVPFPFSQFRASGARHGVH